MDAAPPSVSRSPAHPGPRAELAGPQARPRLSLILLATGTESPSLVQRTVEGATKSLESLAVQYEIVVVDRASAPNAPRLAGLERFAGRNGSVRVIDASNVSGSQACLQAGVASARFDWLLFAPADGSFDTDQLARFVLLGHDFDLVTGLRTTVAGAWSHRLGTRVYNAVAARLLGLGTHDPLCPVKLVHRDSLTQTAFELEGPLAAVALIADAQLNERTIAEVSLTELQTARSSDDVVPHCRHRFWAGIFGVWCHLIQFWWNRVLFPVDSPSARLSESLDALPGDGACGRGQRRPRTVQTCVWDPTRQEEVRRTANVRRVMSASWLSVLSLVAFALLILLPNLSFPFVEPDECRNAQIGFEMQESGDWLVPARNGQPYMDKPPMLFWWLAGSYRLFGPTIEASRYPVALGALLTVLVVFLLGSRLMSARAAWLGSLSLLLSIGFVLTGRFVITDSLLTLFATTTLLCLYQAARAPTRGHTRLCWWAAAGMACGFGVLTKGPISVVLTTPPILAIQWLSHGRIRTHFRDWIAFATATTLIALPWYVAVSMRNDSFLSYFFWEHNVVRYLNGFNHVEPWWFYIPVLLAGMFPSSALLPALCVFLGARSPLLRQKRTLELGYTALAAGWTVLFFSTSSSKLPTYVLPAIPMIALMIGHLLDSVLLVRWPRCGTTLPPYLRHVYDQFPVIAVSTIALAATAGGVVDFCLLPDSMIGIFVSMALAVTVIGGAFVVVRTRVLPRLWKWSLVGLLALPVVSNVLSDIYPEGAAMRSYLANVSVRVRELPEGMVDTKFDVVFFARRPDGAPFFFSEYQVHEFPEPQLDKLRAFLRTTRHGVIIAEPHHIRRLQTELKGIVATTLLCRMGLLYETLSHPGNRSQSVARSPLRRPTVPLRTGQSVTEQPARPLPRAGSSEPRIGVRTGQASSDRSGSSRG